MKTFKEKVIDIVKKIPKGETMAYKQVAAKAGSAGAARAVGTIMANNQDTNIPCHRVIRSNGLMGPYNGLLGASKEEVLRKEGYFK